MYSKIKNKSLKQPFELYGVHYAYETLEEAAKAASLFIDNLMSVEVNGFTCYYYNDGELNHFVYREENAPYVQKNWRLVQVGQWFTTDDGGLMLCLARYDTPNKSSGTNTFLFCVNGAFSTQNYPGVKCFVAMRTGTTGMAEVNPMDATRLVKKDAVWVTDWCIEILTSSEGVSKKQLAYDCYFRVNKKPDAYGINRLLTAKLNKVIELKLLHPKSLLIINRYFGTAMASLKIKLQEKDLDIDRVLDEISYVLKNTTAGSPNKLGAIRLTLELNNMADTQEKEEKKGNALPGHVSDAQEATFTIIPPSQLPEQSPTIINLPAHNDDNSEVVAFPAKKVSR